MRCKHRYNVRLDKGVATCLECEKEITVDTWCDISILEEQNAVFREALERIMNRAHDYGNVLFFGIAQQALQRAGGGE